MGKQCGHRTDRCCRRTIRDRAPVPALHRLQGEVGGPGVRPSRSLPRGFGGREGLSHEAHMGEMIHIVAAPHAYPRSRWQACLRAASVRSRDDEDEADGCVVTQPCLGRGERSARAKAEQNTVCIRTRSVSSWSRCCFLWLWVICWCTKESRQAERAPQRTPLLASQSTRSVRSVRSREYSTMTLNVKFSYKDESSHVCGAPPHLPRATGPMT